MTSSTRNQLETKKKERDRQELEARIEVLELTIKTHPADRCSHGSDCWDAGADEARVANQHVVLLNNALEILAGFYNKEVSLLQHPADPAPPPGFKEDKKIFSLPV